jgi:hypothetical protein
MVTAQKASNKYGEDFGHKKVRTARQTSANVSTNFFQFNSNGYNFELIINPQNEAKNVRRPGFLSNPF